MGFAKVKSSSHWFDELVEETKADLAAYLGRLVSSPEDVQDVMQEAYMKVYCALRDSGPDGHTPAGLLYTVARNISISRLRHLQVVERTATVVEVVEELRTATPSTEDKVSNQQKQRSLLLAVNGLPPKCREVFTLRMIHGQSQRAIAERMGIAVSTVEKHLARGLQLCREELHRDKQVPELDAQSDKAVAES